MSSPVSPPHPEIAKLNKLLNDGTRLDFLGLPSHSEIVQIFAQIVQNDPKPWALLIKADALSNIWKIYYNRISSLRSAGPQHLSDLSQVLTRSESLFSTIKSTLNQSRIPKNQYYTNLMYQCFLYMGDLARYRTQCLEDPKQPGAFQDAKKYYLDAVGQRPEVGNAHNQLAVIAAYSRDYLECIYRTVLSLLVKKPFSNEGAKQNLRLLLEATRSVPALSVSPQERFVGELCYCLGAIYLSNSIEDDILRRVVTEWGELLSEDRFMVGLEEIPGKVLTVCVFVAEASAQPICRAQSLQLLTEILNALIIAFTRRLHTINNVQDLEDTLVLVDHIHGAIIVGCLWIIRNVRNALSACPQLRDSLKTMLEFFIYFQNQYNSSGLTSDVPPVNVKCLPELTEVCHTTISAWSDLFPEIQEADCQVNIEDECAQIRFHATIRILHRMQDHLGYIVPKTQGDVPISHLREEPIQNNKDDDDDDDDDFICPHAFQSSMAQPGTPIVFPSEVQPTAVPTESKGLAVGDAPAEEQGVNYLANFAAMWKS